MRKNKSGKIDKFSDPSDIINNIDWDNLNDVDSFKDGGEVKNKETYKKWKSLVNMSASELKKFYNSEEGKKAGLSVAEAKKAGISRGRTSAAWIMKMKETPVAQWTDNMWRWANKQISFISRMSGMKGDLYDENGNKTRKHTSLLIWGHNPEKKNNGGVITDHQVYYNGKVVDMGYVNDKKQQLKYAAQRIYDNLGTGGHTEAVGYIKTPDNKFYEVSRSSKSAKLLKGEQVDLAKSKFNAGGELVGASNEEVNNACIEETINIINSIKPISKWFVADGKLVIVFKEELMVYDVEQMNHHLQAFTDCHDTLNPEVLLTYKGNHTSVYIELKTDDISVGKFNRGGTIQKQQNSNIMEDIKFNQLPHINTLNVGDEIVIKEEVFTGSLEKPQHVGTRFARCKVVGKGGMEHSFELFVVKSNGAKPFHAGSKIIRPMRNVLENGRLLNLSPQPPITAGIEDIYKGDEVMFNGSNYEVGGVTLTDSINHVHCRDSAGVESKFELNDFMDKSTLIKRK